MKRGEKKKNLYPFLPENNVKLLMNLTRLHILCLYQEYNAKNLKDFESSFKVEGITKPVFKHNINCMQITLIIDKFAGINVTTRKNTSHFGNRRVIHC